MPGKTAREPKAKSTYDDRKKSAAVAEYSLMDAFKNAENKRVEFAAERSNYRLFDEDTFCQRIFKVMEKKKWSASVFVRHTKLDQNYYYRIKSNEANSPRIEVVISLCIGLNIPKSEWMSMFSYARCRLEQKIEHDAYRYIIDKIPVGSVDDFNAAFLGLVEEACKPPLANDIE